MFDFRRAQLILSSAVIVAILVWFTRDGFASYFSGDDLMNIYLAWQRPLSRFAVENAVFFSTGYRPLGNLAYRLLFEIAGFHPLPFRTAGFALVLLNLFLMYRAAAPIATTEIATLTTLFASYNAGVDLYHDTGIIYDVLCFTFYFAALGLYFRVRARKQHLNGAQLAWFVVLFIGALDSKEMAVTLPWVLLSYELLLGEPALGNQVRRWIPALVSALMTVPYVIGKLSGASPLINNVSYALHFSPATYVAGLAHYLDLLVSFHPGWLTMQACILTLVTAAAIAAVTRDRRLCFALVFVLITPLPVVFVAPRGAYVMYIPLFGIALYLAILVIRLRDAVLGSRMRLATFAGCAAALIAFHSQRPWRPAVNPLIRSTVAQLDRVQPRVAGSSKILFLDDPFDKDDPWVLLFLCRLYYGLPELVVDRVKTMPSPPTRAEIDAHDLIFTFRDARLMRVKL